MKKSIGLIIGTVLLTSVLPGLKANAETLGNTKSVQAIQAAAAQNGWVTVGGKSYYYKDNVLVKGWLEYNTGWYLLDSNDGHMLTGWQKYNGGWYYLDTTYGYMKKNWQEINGIFYLFDSTYGYMKTGWQQVDGAWYLLDSTDGYMKKGWQQVDGKWYYLDTTYGYMKTGWQKIDGKEYYFWPSSGSMASDTYIDGYYVGKDGAYVPQTQADKVIAEAKKHIGKPYVWGATGPNSFDCSGLTWYVYKQAVGIDITRTTYTQINVGTPISYSQLQPGDLVFTYDNEHVGIYVGNGQYIHAPQPGDVVKISPITEFYAARRVL